MHLPDKRDLLVLAVSATAHVALVAAVATRSHAPAPAPPPPSEAVVAVFELGPDTSPVSLAVAPGAVSTHAEPWSAPTPRATLPDRPRAQGAPPRAPEGQPVPGSPAGEGATADASAAPARALTLAELGVGKNPFVSGSYGMSGASGSAPAPDTARAAEPPSAKARVEATLRADARAREAALGLGPDGPLRAALADAMYASDAPVTSRVVFAVRADARGNILSLDAVSGDQGLSAFRDMARLARARLGRTTLRLPSTAQGANLRIELTSAWKLPSGHDPGAQVELFGRALTKGEGKAATRVAILPLPKVTCVSPDDPKNELKLPICGVTAPLIATDADPADLGAKPRRIVSTRVLESTIL